MTYGGMGSVEALLLRASPLPIPYRTPKPINFTVPSY
jgi:hypothetical protein